jgi:hypothetical protein
MGSEGRFRSELPLGLLIAVVVGGASPQCDAPQSNRKRPSDAAAPSSTDSSKASNTIANLQRQISLATPQGVLRVATLREASITISVEAGPGLQNPCLSVLAANILVKAGYAAVPSWNPEMEGPMLHILAASTFSKGKTTLTLQGNTGRDVGPNSNVYEAMMISGDRNPTTTEAESLVARVVQSRAFQSYASKVDPAHGAMVGIGNIGPDEIRSACEPGLVRRK